jgi:hypothetical protein
MGSRPFAQLIGALAAYPAAEGWRPAAKTDFKSSLAVRAQSGFATARLRLRCWHSRSVLRWWISSLILYVTKIAQTEREIQQPGGAFLKAFGVPISKYSRTGQERTNRDWKAGYTE